MQIKFLVGQSNQQLADEGKENEDFSSLYKNKQYINGFN